MAPMPSSLSRRREYGAGHQRLNLFKYFLLPCSLELPFANAWCCCADTWPYLLLMVILSSQCQFQSVSHERMLYLLVSRFLALTAREMNVFKSFAAQAKAP